MAIYVLWIAYILIISGLGPPIIAICEIKNIKKLKFELIHRNGRHLTDFFNLLPLEFDFPVFFAIVCLARHVQLFRHFFLRHVQTCTDLLCRVFFHVFPFYLAICEPFLFYNILCFQDVNKKIHIVYYCFHRCLRVLLF